MKRKENHPREVFYLYCAFCGLRFILFFLIMLFVFRTYPSVSIPCFVGDGMFLILIRELLSPNGISRSFFQMCYSTISVVHFIYSLRSENAGRTVFGGDFVTECPKEEVESNPCLSIIPTDDGFGVFG